MKYLIALALVASITGCQMMPGQNHAAKSANHVVLTPDKIEWKPGPPSLPPGSQLAVLDGDPAKPGFFTMRGRFPAGYRIPPHWHPNYERITVISGTFYMGAGDKFDESAARGLPPGTYSTMPPGMKHFAYTKGPVEVQLTSMGPWAINYINPADDPRNSAAK